MLTVVAVLVVLIAVTVIFRGGEVRLTLLLAALALGLLAGRPAVIVQTFLDYFTREQFLLPIGCCMGFAFVLRHTGCDQHLVRLLLRPLRRVRTLLIPGVVLVAATVNVPIVSQSGTAVAVGAVLVPVLRAAGVPAVTAGAALALGASIGGELLNPGAPELQTVSKACKTSTIAIVGHIWPLLLVHLAVTVPLFWFSCRFAGDAATDDAGTPAADDADLPINYVKAVVPLLPLVLLFLTAVPPPVRAIDVPREWLVAEGAAGSYDSRLIGLAMLVGTVVAALTSPAKAGGTARAFFDGAGYALTHVTSLGSSPPAASARSGGGRPARPPAHLVEVWPGLLRPLAALRYRWRSAGCPDRESPRRRACSGFTSSRRRRPGSTR
ncbi:MAG: C4-dicarboxylate transporter DcuC [Gemmataceae bacterium]